MSEFTRLNCAKTLTEAVIHYPVTDADEELYDWGNAPLEQSLGWAYRRAEGVALDGIAEVARQAAATLDAQHAVQTHSHAPEAA